MLPFLKPRAQVGVIVSQRKPDGTKQETGTEGQEDHGLMAAAEDLLKAVHAKDAAAVAAAFRAGFEILESMPHEENSDTDNEEMEE